MNAVLNGIRIVEWSLFQVGPAAGAMLGDLGAEVIKIEERGLGDPMRGFVTVDGLSTAGPAGRNIHFEEHNRNKKGIAVDLRTPEGREIVYKLVAQSDVFLTNYRQKAAVQLGLDYQTICRYNPKIIYAYASGYGPNGPDKDSPSVDIIGEARSGMMMACGEEGAPPMRLMPGIGDRITSIYLAYGVLAALLARERLGIGQEVNTSQLSSFMGLLAFPIVRTLYFDKGYSRHTRTDCQNPIYNYYQCRDGGWLALGLHQSQRYWPTFCQAIGRPELTANPRYGEDVDRMANRRVLIALLDGVFAEKTLSEWEGIMREYDLLATRVNNLDDLQSDPQVVLNGYVTQWDHPAMGMIKFMGQPVQYSETPGLLTRPAPECGEHTEEVLAEICGYAWDEINRLQDAKVI